MKVKKLLSAICVASMWYTGAFAEVLKESTNQQDYEKAIEAVLDYAYGVAQNDWNRIARAYDVDKAQLKLVTGPEGEEKVYILPIRDLWEKVWSQSPVDPDHWVKVLNVNIYEGRLAFVAINNNDVFLDTLSLYKLNGEWKIYDKLSRHLETGNIDEQWFIDTFGFGKE